MTKNKEYIGDSVYVELDEFGQIVLTTENGYGPSNTIVMEPAVLRKFDEWRKWADEIIQQENENNAPPVN